MKRQLTKEELARLFKRQAENRVKMKDVIQRKYKKRFFKIYQSTIEEDLYVGNETQRMSALRYQSERLCGYDLWDFNRFMDFVLIVDKSNWLSPGNGLSSGILMGWAAEVYFKAMKWIEQQIKEDIMNETKDEFFN